MRRTLLLIGLWLIACSSGCYPAYLAPGPTDPHALLKVRRVYHRAVRGPFYQSRSELVLIDGASWLARVDSAAQDAPQTAAVRVAPGLRALELWVRFEHEESRTEMKTVMEQERYSESEHYWDGLVYKSRTVTKTRSVPKTEWVTERYTVVDDHCSSRARWAFANGGVYLVQYTFTGHQQCSLVCLQQEQPAPGMPVLVHPCPAVPAQRA